MARRRLRDASIRTKVLALVMAVTTIALLLASGALLAWDYYQFKTDIGRGLSTRARMVLENSTAAMSFQDHTAARETLETLSPDRHIQVACLYDATDVLFARSSPAGSAEECPTHPPSLDAWFSSDRAHVVVRGKAAGTPAGSVYLESDLEAVSDRARVQALTAAVVLGVVLAVALLLSSVLQRAISEPLFALADTAREVATRSDYSLRARRDSNDELGVLVDAFNGMLTHIEQTEKERAGLIEREREANRAKDEFLMVLSHELRTPLNAIQGWTRMLLLHIIPAEGVDNALQKIERNAQAQTRLIEDLVDVSRLTTGRFRLERVAVDLVVIAHHAIESVRPDADARRITLQARFDALAAPMQGDPDRLQQVIVNLLSNAVKFSPPGSVVAITIQCPDGMCELRVEDHGIGIDAAFLPLVFEPFRQADASSTRVHGGLGLGLSIVKRIVDLHGGDIAIESAGLGQGTTCTVRLPLDATVKEPAGAQTSAPPVTPSALAGLKVLVVDDDPDAREILYVCLSAAGATVERAANVADGLRLAAQVVPDVVITDIAMPEQDGYDLLKALQSLPLESSPRVTIALTAQATSADRERAMAAGFARHVAKPFDARALVELVRETVAAAPR